MREPSDSDIAVGSAEAARVSPPVSSLRGKARVGAGNPSGAATLVFAISAAVSLGIACGVWINSRLASAASASLPPLAMLPSDARATPAPTVVGKPRPGHSDETPSAVAVAAPPPVTGEAAGDGGARSQPANSGVAAARPGGTALRPNPVAPSDVEPAVGAKASPATARSGPAPCALYASASSLTLRGGGAATLILGGPGAHGHAAVTTPDWADIAVFSEGPTDGNRGWMKYSVRSVSRRAGVYAVHFRTPCGSQTIPVKVTPP